MNNHYGNGFIVASKYRDKIHKFWRESDRICVLQLSEANYKCEMKGDLKVKIVKQGAGEKKTINIINAYAPTLDRGKKFPNEVEKFYKQLEKLTKELGKVSSSMTIIAGDLNSKIGKRIGFETCIGKWSRGRRNQNGTSLVEFCEKNDKIIANSCFQHSARHITTWSQTRYDRNSGKAITIYYQIDYVILDQKNKQILTDARSYSGTETYSDHRLVVARMDVKWPKVYKKRTKIEAKKRFDTRELVTNVEKQSEYKD